MRKFTAIFYVFYFYAIYIIVKLLTLKYLFGKPIKQKNRIVFLELFGPPMAGYTARSKYWSDLLNTSQYNAEVYSLTTYSYYKQCMKRKEGLMWFQIKTLWTRFMQCLKSRNAEVLVIRREILMYNDYGNLFFEKWLRAMHTKLVLDFDDDIAAAKHEGKRQLSFFSYVMQEQNNKFTASMKFFNGFIYGTDYLKNHFAQYTFHAKHHLVLPTCVPHFNSILKKYTLNTACKIGWVGSSYNLKNIESVFPALEDLYQKTYFEFILICDENTSHSTSFPLYFIPWSKDREIENLLQIDLGLMPLIRTEASSGKAAFKLLQYMSLGIVPVASAVTVNREIVSDGFNGFLVEDESEWIDVLLKVLQRRNEFSQLGSAAYNSITNKYTFQSNEKTYLNFIHKLVSL